MRSIRTRSIDVKRGAPGRGTGGRRWPKVRWLAAAAIGIAAAVAATAIALLGDGDGPASPRALTSDEVNRLAVSRFLNYQAGGRAVTIIPTLPRLVGTRFQVLFHSAPAVLFS
ncbi:hypothetical protein ACWEV4_33385, partial [Streptomyces sp. NPDC003860]